MISPHSKFISDINLAEILYKKNDFKASKKIYQKLLKNDLENIFFLEKIAGICIRLNQYEEATAYFSTLERLAPNNVLFVCNFAYALDKIGQFDLAIKVLNRAKEIDSSEISIYLNQTVSFCNLKKFDLAKESALHALKLEPLSAITLNNFGAVMQKLGDNASAKAAFETAASIDNSYMEAKINLAAVNILTKEYDKALFLLESELGRVDPESSTAKFLKVKLAYEYLRCGRLTEGWKCYEFALDREIPFENSRWPKRSFNKPKWVGQNIKGKTILIWGEQGIGDEIIFATCIKDLINEGCEIIIECQKRLVDSFARSFKNVKVRESDFSIISPFSSPNNDYDYHLPIASLMSFYRNNIHDFVNSAPYMIVNKNWAEEFENRLTISNKKYRIGICWRSGIINPERNPNNTSLLDWGSIFNLNNFEFVNLQYGECELELKAAEERFNINILRWSDLNLKDDIDKTLSLISRLDFVISIGSAVFSMAASVGVKVFVLLPQKTWDQFGTNYYPFFPNVEVFSPLKSDIQAEALEYVTQRIEEITSPPEDELQPKN